MGTGRSASITELGGFDRDMDGKREGLGRRHPLHHPDVPRGQGRRAGYQMAQDADAQRAAQADAETASAALGRVLAARNNRDGRPSWHGRAGLPVSLSRRGGARLGACTYYNAFVKRQEKLADYQTNPNMALVSYFMCARTDEEARRRADGATFFQFALRYYGASAGRKRPDPYTVNMGTNTTSGR